MPALTYCGRRWFAASDDFVFVPLALAVTRIVLLTSMFGTYALPNPADTFVHAYNVSAIAPDAVADSAHVLSMLGTYALLVMIVDGVAVLSDLLLCGASYRGSILDVALRTPLVRAALSVRVFATWCDLGSAIFGAVFVYRHDVNDPANFARSDEFLEVITPIKVFNVAQFVFVGVIVAAFIAYFDVNGRREAAKTGKLYRDSDDYVHEWQGRCQLCFCCVKLCKGKHSRDDDFSIAFSSVAALFANLFRTVDLVPTDIAAGLLLVRKKQRFESQRAALTRQASSPRMMQGMMSGANLSRSRSAASQADPGSFRFSKQNVAQLRRICPATDMPQLKDINRYVPFTVAAYGWPMVMLAHPTDGCCRLCGSCFCSIQERQLGTGREQEPSIRVTTSQVGEGCCHCNMGAARHWLNGVEAPTATQPSKSELREALLRTAAMAADESEIEILHYYGENELFVVPYFVAKDNGRQCVVVSIRGTLSIHDAFTDLNAQAEDLTVVDPMGGEDAFEVAGQVHGGMLRCARALFKRLMEDTSANGTPLDPCTHLPTILGKWFTNYTLVLTGHSLGAGVAAVLGLMLLEHFPTLQVFSISPPGGLLSCRLATLSERFCISAGVGRDVVLSLSEKAIVELRNELVWCLGHSSRSKATVLACPCFSDYRFFLNKRDDEYEVAAFVRPDEAREMLKHFEDAAAREAPRPELFPPGVIWHFQKTHSTRVGRGCCPAMCPAPLSTFEAQYYPIVVPRTHFRNVKVSPVMVRDHMPYFVAAVVARTVAAAEAGELDEIAERGIDSDSDAASDASDVEVELVHDPESLTTFMRPSISEQRLNDL